MQILIETDITFDACVALLRKDKNALKGGKKYTEYDVNKMMSICMQVRSNNEDIHREVLSREEQRYKHTVELCDEMDRILENYTAVEIKEYEGMSREELLALISELQKKELEDAKKRYDARKEHKEKVERIKAKGQKKLELRNADIAVENPEGEGQAMLKDPKE